MAITAGMTTSLFFFSCETATTEIYTLSLHDALPISRGRGRARRRSAPPAPRGPADRSRRRSEEHTSELQSQFHLVCRLLLEKKKTPSTIKSSSAMTSDTRPPCGLKDECSRRPIGHAT